MQAKMDPLHIAREFCHKVGYVRPKITRDAALECTVFAEIDSWNLNQVDRRIVEPFMRAMLGYVEYCWPNQSFELKLLHTLITGIFLWYDDQVDKLPQAGQEFHARFIRRQTQLHPIFDRLVGLIEKLYDYYEPFAADRMATSALQHPAACVVEYEASMKQDGEPSKHAKFYGLYMRFLTAIGEYFSYAIWDKATHPNLPDFVPTIPDQLIFLAFGNDMLSAHKEILQGDEHNYITFQSHVEGIDKIQVIQHVAEQSATSFFDVALTLKKHPALAKTWQQHGMGFIAWHLDEPRYRLPANLVG